MTTPRGVGEAKLLTAIAKTIRVTAADFLPDFVEAFEAEWKSETTRRSVRSPAADLDSEITRQAARVDRLAAAVADASDIAALLTQLRREDATLRELRARRARLPAATKARPTMPSVQRIRAYFDDLVSTLEADPTGAREALAGSVSTIRLVPLRESYRLELALSEIPTNGPCGGPLFGLPRTTFRALVRSSRGPVSVRVLAPGRRRERDSP